MKTYLGYHFVGDTLRDGRPIPPDGEWLVTQHGLTHGQPPRPPHGTILNFWSIWSSENEI